MQVSSHRPKKRRLWIAAVVVFLGMCVVWLVVPDPPEIATAKAVSLGMSPAEVRKIMGVEPAGYDAVGGHNGVLYGKANRWFLDLKAFFGLRWGDTNYDDWPVHIRYDSSGTAVDRIKRGSEVLEADPPSN